MKTRRLIAAVLLGMLVAGGVLPLVPTGADSTGRVRAAEQEVFAPVGLPYTPNFNQGAWLADGSSMVVAASNGRTLRYDPSSMTFTNISLTGAYSNRNFQAVGASPVSGDAIAVGDYGTAITIGPAPENQRADITTGVTAQLTGVSYKSDGSYACIVGSGGTILLFYPSNRTVVKVNESVLPGYNNASSLSQQVRIAFRPGGNYALLIGYTGSTAKVFKVDDTAITDVTTQFGSTYLYDLAWAPDGSKAIIVGDQAVAYLWNGTTETATPLNLPASGAIVGVAWKDSSNAHLIQYGTGNTANVILYSGSATLSTYQQIVAAPVSINWNPNGTVGFIFTGNDIYRFPNSPPKAVTVTTTGGFIPTGKTTGSFHLNWRDYAEPDPARYEVHVSQTSGFTPGPGTNYTNLTRNYSEPGTTFNWTVNGLALSSTYYAKVRACDTYGACSDSNEVSATISTVPLPPKLSLNARTITDSSITVEWNRSSDPLFSKYAVYYTTAANFTPFPGETASITNRETLTYTTSGGLMPLTNYYFIVRHINNYGVGTDSDVLAVNTTDIPVPVVWITDLQDTSVSLKWLWNAGSVSLTTYEVYYSISKELLTGATPQKSSYNYTSISSLTNRTTYYVLVKAVFYYNSSQQSRSSEILEFTTYAVKPLPKPVVSLSTTTGSSISISWSWSPGSSGESVWYYLIFYSRSSDPVSSGTPINVSSSSYTYTITGLDTGTSYYIEVRVVTKTGKTGDSNTLLTQTLTVTKPPAVTVTAREQKDSYGKVTAWYLEWTPASGSDISKYEIYYCATADFTIVSALMMENVGHTTYGPIKYTVSSYKLQDGKTYYFKVRTVNNAGGFADSREVSLKYDAAPQAVQIYTPSSGDISFNSVKFKWAKSSAADFKAYIIEYKKSKDSKWTEFRRIENRDTTEVLVDVLVPDTNYNFRVSVLDQGGLSTASTSYASAETKENIIYTLFFGETAFCLPLFLLIIAGAVLGGLAKKRRGAAMAGAPFVVVLLLWFILTVAGAAIGIALSFTQVLMMLVIAIVIGVVIGVSRAAVRKVRSVRAAAEYRKRQAEMAAEELRKKTEAVNATITTLEQRIVALERVVPKEQLTTAWGTLSEAKTARQENNILLAEEAAGRCEKVVAEHDSRIAEAGKLRERLEGIKRRIEVVASTPKAPDTGKARGSVAEAEKALAMFNIPDATAAVNKCENALSELEQFAKDKSTQISELQARIRKIESEAESLSRWLGEDVVRALGLDPKKVNPAEFELARGREKEARHTLYSKIQEAADLLGKDRLPDAREAAGAAERAIESLGTIRGEREEINNDLNVLAEDLKKAPEWADINLATYMGKVEKAKLNLTYNRTDEARRIYSELSEEAESLETTYRPSISVIPPSGEFLKDEYESVEIGVRNDGNALARSLVVTVNGPIDFGENGNNRIDLESIGPGEYKKLTKKMAFVRGGDVDVKVSVSFSDFHDAEYEPVSADGAIKVVRERTAAPAQAAAAQKGNVIINARPLLQEGFLIFKMAVINKSGLALMNAQVLLRYKREILMFHHMNPPTLRDRYKYIVGEEEMEDKLVLGSLDPQVDQEVTVELCYHPYICTETTIEAELRYKDVQGKTVSVMCEPKKFGCYCPTFGPGETPNPAVALSIYESSAIKDMRAEPIASGVSLPTAFEVLRSAFTGLGLSQVGKGRMRKSPFRAEAIFHGTAEEQQRKAGYVVIAIVSEMSSTGADGELSGMAEIHVGAEGRTRVTALLATLSEKFNAALEKQANIKRPVYNIDMRSYQTVIKDSMIYKSTLGGGEGAAGTTEISDSAVVGGKLPGPAKVTDSVVVQTQTGAAPPPPLPQGRDQRMQRFINFYYAAYRERMFNDGMIDETERGFLNEMVEGYELPADIVRAIEARADAEYGADRAKRMRGAMGGGAPAAPKPAGGHVCPNPNCRQPVQPNWLECPECHTKL